MIGGANSPKPSGLLNEYSLNFDGANDRVGCGDSNDFSFGNGTTDSPFSISAWINVNAFGLFTKSPIVSKNHSSQQEYTFYVDSNGALYFVLYDTLGGSSDHATISSAVSGTISQGSWFHVVASYAGGGVSGMGMFVNGLALSTSALTNNYTAMDNGTAPFNIGHDKVFRNVFNGNIDEVSLWDKKLDLSDASSLYNSGTPTDLTGMSNLVGWWRMGDPNGTAAYPTIVDQSTNNNDGTMTNMTSSDIETVVP